MAVTGLEDPSWAVFSALFVVQANVGGTIGSALWRIAGALIGAVIAVLLMWIFSRQGLAYRCGDVGRRKPHELDLGALS